MVAIAQAQKEGVVACIDTEESFDAEDARQAGVDLSALLISQPVFREHATEIADSFMRSGACILVLIFWGPMTCPCSCGDAHPHRIATRHTADGITVYVWSDGGLSSPFFSVRGLGAPASKYTRERRARAVRLVMDDFGVFDLRELAVLVKSAEECLGHSYTDQSLLRLDAIRRANRRLQKRAEWII
jgi:hypothetical protein